MSGRKRRKKNKIDRLFDKEESFLVLFLEIANFTKDERLLVKGRDDPRKAKKIEENLR